MKSQNSLSHLPRSQRQNPRLSALLLTVLAGSTLLGAPLAGRGAVAQAQTVQPTPITRPANSTKNITRPTNSSKPITRQAAPTGNITRNANPVGAITRGANPNGPITGSTGSSFTGNSTTAPTTNVPVVNGGVINGGVIYDPYGIATAPGVIVNNSGGVGAANPAGGAGVVPSPGSGVINGPSNSPLAGRPVRVRTSGNHPSGTQPLLNNPNLPLVTGFVTSMTSKIGFMMRVGDKMVHVTEARGLPANLSVGDLVQVQGIRQGILFKAGAVDIVRDR